MSNKWDEFAVTPSKKFGYDVPMFQPSVFREYRGEIFTTFHSGQHPVMTKIGEGNEIHGRFSKSYKGEVFNVGLSSANLSKQELLEKIQSHVKDFAVSYNDFYEDPDKRDYIVSNAKIEATGWLPQWDLDRGIKQLIQGYQMIVPKMGAEFRNGFPLGYANQT